MNMFLKSLLELLQRGVKSVKQDYPATSNMNAAYHKKFKTCMS